MWQGVRVGASSKLGSTWPDWDELNSQLNSTKSVLKRILTLLKNLWMPPRACTCRMRCCLMFTKSMLLCLPRPLLLLLKLLLPLLRVHDPLMKVEWVEYVRQCSVHRKSCSGPGWVLFMPFFRCCWLLLLLMQPTLGGCCLVAYQHTAGRLQAKRWKTNNQYLFWA